MNTSSATSGPIAAGAGSASVNKNNSTILKETACSFPPKTVLQGSDAFHTRPGDTRTFSPNELVCVRDLSPFISKQFGTSLHAARYIKPNPGKDGQIRSHVLRGKKNKSDWYMTIFENVGKYTSPVAAIIRNKIPNSFNRTMVNENGNPTGQTTPVSIPNNIKDKIVSYLGLPKTRRQRKRKQRQTRKQNSSMSRR